MEKSTQETGKVLVADKHVSVSSTVGLESVSSVPECGKKVHGLWSGSLELLGSRWMGMQSQQYTSVLDQCSSHTKESSFHGIGEKAEEIKF